MKNNLITEMKNGFETAYINSSAASNLAYRPEFISNNYKRGKKVLSSIEDELLKCDQFQISVAFITLGGITPLLQTLRELEDGGIKGEILTTNYLTFTEPKALKKLNDFSNITLKMYNVDVTIEDFHTKGYIFKKEEIYRIIIGSSNITKTALTTNREWNTRLISTEEGEVTQNIIEEFNELWNSEYVQLFVRKNKDDKISKEFYYLGRMTATGQAREFIMQNTDKTAVEIEWILNTPVREDIYEYIINE